MLHWESFQDESTFFIAEPIKLYQHAILGRAWMQKHKCSMDWDKNTINVTHNGCHMSLPLVDQNTKHTVALTCDFLPPSTPKMHLFLKGTHDHEASTLRAPPLQKPITTLPKLGVPPSSKRVYTASHTQTHKPTNQRTKLVWIPKNLLLAQGYYNGNTTIWIPKNKPSPSPHTRPLPNTNKHKQQRGNTASISQPKPPYETSLETSP